MNRKEKAIQLKKHRTCYVCKNLGLPHADFTGYSSADINFDHWKPKGLIGADQKTLIDNQVPIHAHRDGQSYLDLKYESSTKRNCHKGKSNRFSSGEDWVCAVKIWRRALTIAYSDDLLPGRKGEDTQYDVDISWDEKSGHAVFRGDKYPMMVQRTHLGSTESVWRSISTVVPADLLWTDAGVQSRPAAQERVAEFAIHLRTHPLLSPILCRLDKKRLNVFDGNHRLCAFLLARPTDPVPVTIFEGPDHTVFLDVVAKAHDEYTQQKYQYTAKALKYSAISADELETAQKRFGAEASERLAWEGMLSKDAALRIVGAITEALDSAGGWRERWKKLGLTDKSWNDFLGMYAKRAPANESFSSVNYHREDELKNLSLLCRLFDEELFTKLAKFPAAKASLRTKFWKTAHKRFQKRAGQVVRDTLKLPETPPWIAYTKRWNQHIESMFRGAVRKWAESPAWRNKTAANNEPEVAAHLNKYGFTENYLM